jgi:hypothetical protein
VPAARRGAGILGLWSHTSVRRHDFQVRSPHIDIVTVHSLSLIDVLTFGRPSLCITHAPGHMLVLDELNEALSLS